MTLDQNTFRTELKRLIPRLRRFGHALAGSADAGDDLLQDALEKALKREQQFTPGTRLDSWMYRIMQTTWIDTIRSRTRQANRLTPLDSVAEPAGEDGRRDFPARIAFSEVRLAMQSLSDDERIVLALVAIEGFTYQEASETLDIPIGTVMSRVSRARKNLVRILGHDYENPAD